MKNEEKVNFYHYDKLMLNGLINKNIEDWHHLDNPQIKQELNLDHQFEIHRYLKYLHEILSE